MGNIKIFLQEIGGKDRFQAITLNENIDYWDIFDLIRMHVLPPNRHYRFYDNPDGLGVDLERKRFPDRRIFQDESKLYVEKVAVPRHFEAWQGARLVPVSGLTHYSKIVLRRRNGILVVHNIGEIHERDSECNVKMRERLSVVQLIKNTLSQDFPVDIFLEREFGEHPALESGEKSQRFYSQRTNFQKIENLVDPCIPYYQKYLQRYGREVECKFPKARVHYTDFRKNFFGLPARMPLDEFYLNKKNIFKDYFKYVMSQIQSISDVRERHFMYKLIEDAKNLLKGEESLYHKKEEYVHSDIFSYITHLWILDLNMIARILRDYDEQPVRHAIIYSGDRHSKMYDKFFKELGADIFKSPKTTRKIEGSSYNFSVHCTPIPLVISEKWPGHATPVLDFSEELPGEYNINKPDHLLYSHVPLHYNMRQEDSRITTLSLPEVVNRRKKRHISDRTMRNEMRDFRKWGGGDFGTSRG